MRDTSKFLVKKGPYRGTYRDSWAITQRELPTWAKEFIKITIHLQPARTHVLTIHRVCLIANLLSSCIPEDIAISFSKKRYRSSVQITAPPGTSILTVRASARNSRRVFHYSIASVNKKPYNDKTAFFEVNPSTGTVLLELFPDLYIYLLGI